MVLTAQSVILHNINLTMKAFIKIVCIAGCVLLVSCVKKQTAAELLKDKDMRAEIMTAISNDSAMAIEMLSRMSSTGAAEKMMPMTCQVLSNIMASEAMAKDTTMQNLVISGMMQLMVRDPVLCDKTCTRIRQNKMMLNMLQRPATDTATVLRPHGR